jgi:REP element-mobilizing transposase RayT
MHHPPHGYLPTFRTYGTWLRGDTRGSVQHHGFTSRGAPLLTPSGPWRAYSHEVMREEPMVLSPRARPLIAMAIRDVCEHRRWRLAAVNLRTNHAHVVVGRELEPASAMVALKAWSTSRMREAAGCEWNACAQPGCENRQAEASACSTGIRSRGFGWVVR